MEHKKIVSYLDKDNFCILQPVYYLYEEKPAWRKVTTGSMEHCMELFASVADWTWATDKEEKQHRDMHTKEVIFYESIGKPQKADAIRAKYNP